MSRQADPHARADKLFEGLIAKATAPDTGLLLEAIQHLCMVMVEVTIGQNDQNKLLSQLLDPLPEKLDNINASIQDRD